MELKNIKYLFGLISLVLIVSGAIIFYFGILHVLDTAWSVMCAPPLLDPYCLGGAMGLMFVFLPPAIGFLMIIFGITCIVIRQKLSKNLLAVVCIVCGKKIQNHSVKEIKVCNNKSQSGNFCDNCGNSLKPTSKFCGSCGNQV